jgi:hypothetical protein
VTVCVDVAVDVAVFLTCVIVRVAVDLRVRVFLTTVLVFVMVSTGFFWSWTCIWFDVAERAGAEPEIETESLLEDEEGSKEIVAFESDEREDSLTESEPDRAVFDIPAVAVVVLESVTVVVECTVSRTEMKNKNNSKKSVCRCRRRLCIMSTSV